MLDGAVLLNQAVSVPSAVVAFKLKYLLAPPNPECQHIQLVELLLVHLNIKKSGADSNPCPNVGLAPLTVPPEPV